MGLRMGRIKKEIDEIKKFRKKYNEDHANEYDNEWWNDENALEEFKGFRKFVKIKPGEVILDIATGTGTFLIPFFCPYLSCNFVCSTDQK